MDLFAIIHTFLCRYLLREERRRQKKIGALLKFNLARGAAKSPCRN